MQSSKRIPKLTNVSDAGDPLTKSELKKRLTLMGMSLSPTEHDRQYYKKLYDDTNKVLHKVTRDRTSFAPNETLGHKRERSNSRNSSKKKPKATKRIHTRDSKITKEKNDSKSKPKKINNKNGGGEDDKILVTDKYINEEESIKPLITSHQPNENWGYRNLVRNILTDINKANPESQYEVNVPQRQFTFKTSYVNLKEDDSPISDEESIKESPKKEKVNLIKTTSYGIKNNITFTSYVANNEKEINIKKFEPNVPLVFNSEMEILENPNSKEEPQKLIIDLNEKQENPFEADKNINNIQNPVIESKGIASMEIENNYDEPEPAKKIRRSKGIKNNNINNENLKELMPVESDIKDEMPVEVEPKKPEEIKIEKPVEILPEKQEEFPVEEQPEKQKEVPVEEPPKKEEIVEKEVAPRESQDNKEKSSNEPNENIFLYSDNNPEEKAENPLSKFLKKFRNPSNNSDNVFSVNKNFFDEQRNNVQFPSITHNYDENIYNKEPEKPILNHFYRNTDDKQVEIKSNILPNTIDNNPKPENPPSIFPNNPNNQSNLFSNNIPNKTNNLPIYEDNKNETNILEVSNNSNPFKPSFINNLRNKSKERIDIEGGEVNNNKNENNLNAFSKSRSQGENIFCRTEIDGKKERALSQSELIRHYPKTSPVDTKAEKEKREQEINRSIHNTVLDAPFTLGNYNSDFNTNNQNVQDFYSSKISDENLKKALVVLGIIVFLSFIILSIYHNSTEQGLISLQHPDFYNVFIPICLLAVFGTILYYKYANSKKKINQTIQEENTNENKEQPMEVEEENDNPNKATAQNDYNILLYQLKDQRDNFLRRNEYGLDEAGLEGIVRSSFIEESAQRNGLNSVDYVNDVLPFVEDLIKNNSNISTSEVTLEGKPETLWKLEN